MKKVSTIPALYICHDLYIPKDQRQDVIDLLRYMTGFDLTISTNQPAMDAIKSFCINYIAQQQPAIMTEDAKTAKKVIQKKLAKEDLETAANIAKKWAGNAIDRHGKTIDLLPLSKASLQSLDTLLVNKGLDLHEEKSVQTQIEEALAESKQTLEKMGLFKVNPQAEVAIDNILETLQKHPDSIDDFLKNPMPYIEDALSEKSMETYRDILNAQTRLFIEELKESANNTKDYLKNFWQPKP